MSGTIYARDPSGNPIEISASAAGKLLIDIGALSIGDVEIKNDSGNPVPTSPAGLSALGYQQITSLSSAAALTVPSGATVALIQAESQSIRWRDDGTNPTTSVGMVLAAGESLFFTGSLSAFRAIEITASAKLNISYYG